jgi:cell division protein FtsI (penicillin-binding protein 3)
MSNAMRDVPIFPIRRLLVMGVFLLAMGVLVVRAVELQIFQHDFLSKKGSSYYTREVEIPSHRGMFKDRHGEILGVSSPVDSVCINPSETALEPEKLSRLASLLSMSERSIRKRVDNNAGKEFIYLKRQLPPELAEQVAALQIPGISIEREYHRFYPQGEMLGHLLGFTNIDDQGQEGLESLYNKQLSGKAGRKRVIRDRLGGIVEDVEQLASMRPGADLHLSIDRRIQYLAYRELKAAVAANRAKSGSIVLLDARTGEVLAMANQPSFNPNDRSQMKGNLYRNRAVKDLLEPGSTIKPFTVAAALETGRYTPNTLVNTSPGFIKISGHTIKDIENYGEIDLNTIIGKSSNVGATMLSMSIPPERLWQVLSQVGFGRTTGSGFPGEENGTLRDYGQWYPLDRATVAFGYGLSVTPLQLAQAYTVLAADGVYHPVSFLAIDQPLDSVKVLSPQNARAVRKMMQQVVAPEGTGYLAAVEGYRVAGKTGTARKSVNGGYSEDEHIALFAGMVPAENPRLVAVVVIREPQAGKFYGGDVAAPVFSRVMSGALRLMNVPPDDLSGTRVDGLLNQGGAI